MKMTVRITSLLLLAIVFSCSLIGCSLMSNPEYCGIWEVVSRDTRDGDSFQIKVTPNNITVEQQYDGATWKSQPASYTVSKDDYNTYLEFTLEGSSAVLVFINEDMVGLCNADGNYSSKYEAVTPNGTLFNADATWLFRKDAGTTTLPSNLRNQFAQWGIDSEFYYYENAQVIAIPDYWGFPAMAVTVDGELMGMENITLRGFGHKYIIRAQGNFLITDNK